VTARIEQRPHTYTARLKTAHTLELGLLLDTAPDYTLFLSSHLERFGLDDPFIRFWGTFRNGCLVAVLMMSGQRAGIYALDNASLHPLLEIAQRQRVNFLMGPRDMVGYALEQLPHLPIKRQESHIFATLPAQRFRPRQAHLPPGSTLRKATAADVEALTTLYGGAAGFENASPGQVRQAMIERVYRFHTRVVEAHGRLVAGASTSAESLSSAMIGGVWTLPNERNQGYSTAVVSALAADLLAEGRQPSLFYLADNAPAAHVYTKIGFRERGPWTVVYFHHPRQGRSSLA
jgi:GNAT superfamily N-acetyltransferase